MKQTTIENLHSGDFFTLEPISNPKLSQVYIRGIYNRSSKKYCAVNFSENLIPYSGSFKKGTIVYVGFTF